MFLIISELILCCGTLINCINFPYPLLKLLFDILLYLGLHKMQKNPLLESRSITLMLLLLLLISHTQGTFQAPLVLFGTFLFC